LNAQASRTRRTTRARLSRAVYGKPRPIPTGTWSGMTVVDARRGADVAAASTPARATRTT
jgi:hypothetical protein